MLIELGGGTNPHPRADVVIDLHHPRGSPPQDATVGQFGRWWTGATITHDGLGRPVGDWFWPDDSIDEVYASHFMEHVPHGQPLLNVMNEAWRVLKPGGTFTMILPLIGYTDPMTGAPQSSHVGWQPWADPTHVSFWWFPEALWYFGRGQYAPNADYGYKLWEPLGPYIDNAQWWPSAPVGAMTDGGSFWTVRDGWEGLARLVKP